MKYRSAIARYARASSKGMESLLGAIILMPFLLVYWLYQAVKGK